MTNFTSDLSAAERQKRMMDILILHDRFKEAVELVSQTHMPVVGGVHSTGVIALLAGESRTGKTAAITHYTRRFPPIVQSDGIRFPVLLVDMPVDGSPRGILAALASALEMKHSQRMNNPALFEAILKNMRARGVELLILDEFQGVFDKSNPRLAKFARDVLRKLLNLGSLSIVCVGLRETYEFISADPQLKGRGGLPYRLLQPYNWENQEERKLFRLLCDEFDRHLPFAQRSGLIQKSIAYRLYYASENGNIGHLKRFISDAGCLAINDGSARIELYHFAEAFERIKVPGSSYNPFVNQPDQLSNPGVVPSLDIRSANAAFSKNKNLAV